MKTFSTSLLLSVILLTACKTEQKDFNIVFALESLNSYKIELEIKSDKSYSIKKQNIYFDRIARQANINSAEGEMTDEEWNELTQLVAAARLFKMKDSYGFTENANNDDDLFRNMMYRLEYTEGTKIKSLLIHPDLSYKYPENLTKLTTFLSKFSSSHSEK